MIFVPCRKCGFNQNTARNSSTSENGVVSYLLPISGRYGNTTIFSGVRVHLKKLLVIRYPVFDPLVVVT